MRNTYEILEEQIRIQTDLPLLSVQKIEIWHQANAHGTLRIWAEVREEEQEEILYTDWTDTQILVDREAEAEEPFFYGRIERLLCGRENRLLTVEIRGIGETICLDRETKSQSFQKKDMTYKQIVHQVLKGYGTGGMIWMVGEDRAIETPILQYEETDWEFLKRICSHFHGKLIADIKTGKPAFFFGMCRGMKREFDETEVVGFGFPSSYYTDGCYRDGVPKSQAFCIEVRTKKHWQMGDSVLFEGRTYRVFERRIVYAFGELVCTYRLGGSGLYYQERLFPTHLVGARIEGTIRKCEEEVVYLQLDIDTEERADYPWSWTPEINNLCYCMPEVGTKAVLYLPTKEEKDGQVILSTVSNPYKEQYSNPQNREFFTKDQKKVGLYPERLFFEGKDRKEELSLEDRVGIRLISEKDLSIKAAGNVVISGNKILEVAPVDVVHRTERANIEICRDLNFYAPGGVQAIGTGEGGTEEKKKEEKEKNELDHWKLAYYALGSIPAVELSDLQSVTDLIKLYACGSIPLIGDGATVVALAEVMEGKKEKETSFPHAFRAMEDYTIKGGYALPNEEETDSTEGKGELNLKQEVMIEESISEFLQRKNKFFPFEVIKEYMKEHILNVTCTNAESEEFLHIKKEGRLVPVNKITELNKTDITIDGQFSKCKSRKDGKCILNADYIEEKEWKNSDHSDTQKEVLDQEKAYMICIASEGSRGVIYFYQAGKGVKEKIGELSKMATSSKGIEMIRKYEMSSEVLKEWGLGEFDKNGELIGIYPHYVFKESGTAEKYVSDGGITFGYGHFVSEESYKKDKSEKELVDKYASGAPLLPSYIPKNGVTYKVPNSSYLSIEKVDELMRKDLRKKEDALNSFLEENNIQLNFHQFDALVVFSYQYGEGWWTREPERKLPEYIRKGNGNYEPKEVEYIFNLHDYEERRAEEAKVFNYGYDN